MTAKLRNGSYCFDENGRMIHVSGSEEILNRALIRLTVRRGQFPLDPELGSELYKLDYTAASEDRLHTLIVQALSPISEIEVTGLEKIQNREQDRLDLNLSVRIGEMQTSLII